MGSPPTPYNSTVRLIVYPTGLGTSQFQRLFMLKGEFFCNVSSRYHFFTHGSYIDVKSRVESIYGSEKPNRRLLSELEAKNGKTQFSKAQFEWIARIQGATKRCKSVSTVHNT